MVEKRRFLKNAIQADLAELLNKGYTELYLDNEMTPDEFMQKLKNIESYFADQIIDHIELTNNLYK